MLCIYFTNYFINESASLIAGKKTSLSYWDL
jgi:hypothetical protein